MAELTRLPGIDGARPVYQERRHCFIVGLVTGINPAMIVRPSAGRILSRGILHQERGKRSPFDIGGQVRTGIPQIIEPEQIAAPRNFRG